MVYLYGAGGHGKVVLDALEESGVVVGGFFDEDITKKIEPYNCNLFPGHLSAPSHGLIITVGNNRVRKLIAEKYRLPYSKAIHPASVISKKSVIGNGSVVMAKAVINADTKIGNHCIINTGAIVEHDCFIEDFVHIAPNATLCGSIYVGEGSLIGAGAVIIPGVKIGKWAIVGAGSVVLKNVEDNTTVVGNPAAGI